MKLLMSAALAAYLLIRPASCLAAAREAMALWADAVAPALFPFMVLLPALSGADARRAYALVFGRALKTCFRLPGELCAAVVVGMVAGSPAGAICVSRSAENALPAQRLAAGILASGCGPVFLVCSVGSAMFGDAFVGVKLLASMWTALLLSGTVAARLPLKMNGKTETAPLMPSRASVREAVMAILTVCGWMTLFGVIASAFPAFLRPVFEVSAGCRAACAAGRADMAALMCGFGGLCACCQNISCLHSCGVSGTLFLLFKLLSGGLSMGIYKLCEYLPSVRVPVGRDAYVSGAVAACAAVGLVCLVSLVWMAKRKNTRAVR